MLNKRYLIIFKIIFSFQCLFAEIAQSSSVTFNELVMLNNKITLSNFSEEELKNNYQYCDYSYDVIKYLEKHIELNSEFFPIYLHLSYKLANYFQQHDRPADAEIVTQFALLAIERKFPGISSWEPFKICEILGTEDIRLPSLYAAICHYAGKAYFYRPKSDESKNVEDLNQAERYIKKALTLREILDKENDQYAEPLDNGKCHFYASHTIVFNRSLANLYLSKNDYAQALSLFEKNIENTSSEFEKYISTLPCVTIYSKLAREEWDQSKAYAIYKKANDKANDVMAYLKKKKDFSGAPKAVIVLSKFYGDSTNPFYDLSKCKWLLESFLLSREYSKTQMNMIKKELGHLYQELSDACFNESIESEMSLKEAYQLAMTEPLMSLSIDDRIKKLIDLAITFRKHNKFFESTLLLSNAFSHIEEEEERLSNDLWYQLYLTEKEYIATFDTSHIRKQNDMTFEAYKATVQRYRTKLEAMRKNYDLELPLELAWEGQFQINNQVKMLTESMFKDTLALFKPSPVPFAIIGLGSFSHYLSTPYSDLEFVLVHNPLNDLNDKKYFEQLSNVFLMRLVAIQETPIQNYKSFSCLANINTSSLDALLGFRPDVGGINSGSIGKSLRLFGTPKEIIALIPELSWVCQLHHGVNLFGSIDLINKVKEDAEQILTKASQKEWEYLINEHFMLNQGGVLFVNLQGDKCYSIKHPYYRMISIMLNYLASYHSITHHVPQMILQELVNHKYIDRSECEQVDLFIRKLSALRSYYYMQNKGQNEQLPLTENNLEAYFKHNEEFYNVINILLKGFPLSSNKHYVNIEQMRFNILCRSGYLEKVKQEIEQNDPILWEVRGNLAMLEMKPIEAYWLYQCAYQEDPYNASLLFKLAEASIYCKNNEGTLNAKFYLSQIDEYLKSVWKEDPFLRLKANYLKILFERLNGNWTAVKRLLDQQKSENNSIIKHGSLINSLMELEKARFECSQENREKAKEHLKKGEVMLLRKYGPLHPFILPFYEEILYCLEPKDFYERIDYQNKISQIKTLFPRMHWCGALDSWLLD